MNKFKLTIELETSNLKDTLALQAAFAEFVHVALMGHGTEGRGKDLAIAIAGSQANILGMQYQAIRPKK